MGMDENYELITQTYHKGGMPRVHPVVAKLVEMPQAQIGDTTVVEKPVEVPQAQTADKGVTEKLIGMMIQTSKCNPFGHFNSLNAKEQPLIHITSITSTMSQSIH